MLEKNKLMGFSGSKKTVEEWSLQEAEKGQQDKNLRRAQGDEPGQGSSLTAVNPEDSCEQ